ncbi:hypothetical protein EEB14_52180 [Rhodococcus sp. WS4]|nr:hypothetical protein EEB14_52180 [Rhodococcus sp. WS4]
MTIALLAIAFRILWYSGRLFVFPFSQVADGFWMALPLAILIRLVPKVGVSSLYYLTWSLFNTFFQGEGPLTAVLLLPVGILPDLFLYLRRRRIDSSMTVIVTATSAAFFYSALLSILYKYYFLYPVTPEVWAYILPFCVVAAAIGALIGDRLGKRVKPLLR